MNVSRDTWVASQKQSFKSLTALVHPHHISPGLHLTTQQVTSSRQKTLSNTYKKSASQLVFTLWSN